MFIAAHHNSGFKINRIFVTTYRSRQRPPKRGARLNVNKKRRQTINVRKKQGGERKTRGKKNCGAKKRKATRRIKRLKEGKPTSRDTRRYGVVRGWLQKLRKNSQYNMKTVYVITIFLYNFFHTIFFIQFFSYNFFHTIFFIQFFDTIRVHIIPFIRTTY